MAEFDKDGWERHWRRGHSAGPGAMSANPPNPHLVAEIGGLEPGTALDAGCGAGAEAIWLAEAGWQVTAADISTEALAIAAERAEAAGAADRISWIEADLSVWEPAARFDLVTTHYAHPAIPQLEFYDRLAEWVAPGGTLLIVGHLHATGSAGHHQGDGSAAHHHADGPAAHHHPAEASTDAESITALLPESNWQIATADERTRALPGHGPHGTTLHDVVVRAKRRA